MSFNVCQIIVALVALVAAGSEGVTITCSNRTCNEVLFFSDACSWIVLNDVFNASSCLCSNSCGREIR